MASSPPDRETRILKMPGGRLLGYAEYGDPQGMPVLCFHGTPGCRWMFQLGSPLAAEHGIRLIAPDRPGYGVSSPVAARQLSDWPGDIAWLADRLGISDFAVIGVSGGGPYAAACAACLADRISAAALVSPAGPVGLSEIAEHLSREHKRIFSSLARSPRLIDATFTAMRFAVTYSPSLALRGLMARAASVDREILSDRVIGDNLITSLAEGLVDGISGAAQDLWLFAAPWDFAPGEIAIPCKVWQGDLDRNVPPAAAYHLAETIPGCELEVLSGTGHYWIYRHFDQVLDWVRSHVPAVPETV